MCRLFKRPDDFEPSGLGQAPTGFKKKKNFKQWLSGTIRKKDMQIPHLLVELLLVDLKCVNTARLKNVGHKSNDAVTSW